MLREARASPAETSRLLSAAFLDRLAHHGWPGNIRELRNAVDRALAMGPWEPEAEIAPAIAPGSAPAVDLSRPFKQARDEWTARFERAYLAALLDHHAGSIRPAARAAGIDRVHLYRLLARHGLGRSTD
jgi:two-component system response regulator GlrR